MRCPTCPDTLLVITERQGVEIDYCPQCRGVWLDRGELDKLLDRAAAAQAAAAPAPYGRDRYSGNASPRPYETPYPHQKKHHKTKSWLSEIFD